MNVFLDKISKKDAGTEVQYVIRNVIATGDLMQRVDIESFNKYPWGRFDVINNYNGQVGYIKNFEIQGRVTVFRSGKLISTGAKSVMGSAEQLIKAYNILLANNLVKSTFIETRVRNIVVTSKLEDLVFNNFIRRSGVIYEPDQFPGAIYKTCHFTTALVFSSGNIVLTGAKEEKQIIESIKEINTLCC